MERRELNILDVIKKTDPFVDSIYELILGDKNNICLYIIIGEYEAHSIVCALENIQMPRPSIHDITKTIGDTIGFTIDYVCIDKYHDGVFYTKISLSHNGTSHEIESRLSDAVALATRFCCPIYTTSEILTQAGREYIPSENSMTNGIDFFDFLNVGDQDALLEDKNTNNAKRQEDTEDWDTEKEEELSDIAFQQLISDISFFTMKELQNELERAIENEDFEYATQIRDEIKRRSISK